MILRVGVFLKIIFFITNTEKYPQFIIYYKNDKCFLVFDIYISLLCFISYFFLKKQKRKDWKNACWPKMSNIIFLFLLQIESIGPVDKQINLFSPSNINLQNTRNLILSNHMPEMSVSIWDTFIVDSLVENTFVFSFLKEGFNPNFPSFRFLSVLPSDVLILYKRELFLFFLFTFWP